MSGARSNEPAVTVPGRLVHVLAFASVVLLYPGPASIVCGQSPYQYDNIVLYRSDHDEKKCSYHFSTKTFGDVTGGEFYFHSDGHFYANNVGQPGIADLGAQAPFVPKETDIPPSTSYLPRVDVKTRHVYLTRARLGEDNRYILFRVNYLSMEGKALGLEYYLFDTGTIVVQANEPGRFTITGPRAYSGEGPHWQKENALTGAYTIAFDEIEGCKMIASQTDVLGRGATIVFSATYESLPEPDPTPGLKPVPGPGPTPPADISGLPLQVIVALIGAVATIIAAYLGYRAIAKRPK